MQEVLGGRYEVKPSGCWEFIGSRHKQGYGRVKRSGRVEFAHRKSWREAFGPIPDDQQVLHRCDNPPCIRLGHLFLGDHAANMEDMRLKGRANGGGGRSRSGAGATKLDWDKARAIRADPRPHAEIATCYGVSRALVTQIKGGKKWREGD